ncbi:hypothetical protein TNCV_4499031 [Trichonephila clavipes]|nr:hypothetical protein TNCV_4499031 [Trichonephila clavipes]
MDDLREMHEQEQIIEGLESLDPVQSEDRMAVGNWTEGLCLTEKGLQIFENADFNEERIFFQQNKECLACSQPRMPRAHQAGFSRRFLAGVGFFESVRSHGPGLALLTNGGVQQQGHEDSA